MNDQNADRISSSSSSSSSSSLSLSSLSTARKQGDSRMGLENIMNDDVIRKNREEKAVQIRKDKRNDMTNMRRQKFVEDRSKDSEASARKRRENVIRTLESLAENTNQIYSDTVTYQREALEFFRRLLSLDHKPPINVVIERGVVPRIVDLISSPSTEVSFEACWCVTNIACGDLSYINILLDLGVIPKLFQLIQRNNESHVKEQVLWALSNLITEPTGRCKFELLSLHIIDILLWQLDIDAPVDRREESPGLSLMRYTSWLLCNLCRHKSEPLISIENQRSVLYAFTDLLYSPDMEILPDICTCVGLLCEIRSENVSYCLEQGMLRRLLELCDTSISSYAIRPICIMCRSPDIIHRKLLMSSLSLNTLEKMIKVLEMSLSSTNASTIMTRSSGEAQMLCVARGMVGPLDINSTNKANEETCVEIFKTLSTLFQTDIQYCLKAVDNQVIVYLVNAITEQDSYLIRISAGYCLSELVLRLTIQNYTYSIRKIIQAYIKLLSTTDNQLLIIALRSVMKLLQFILQLQKQQQQQQQPELELKLSTMEEENEGYDEVELENRLVWLCNYPHAEVSSLAFKVQDISHAVQNQSS